MVGRPSRRVRLIVAIVAALAILAPLVWLWQSSLVPSSYSVAGMGDLDYGGGLVGDHDHASTARSINDIVVDPARKADVRVDLVAEQQNLSIGGRSVITAAETRVPATTAAGVAKTSSRLSTPGM